MNRFETVCLEEAKKAFLKGEVPVGCVVVKDGKVIARAHNRTEETGNPTAHAEMLAIQEAVRTLGSKYLYHCELYVSLEPCPMCAYAIVLARIEKVVFLAQDERRGAVISRYNLFEEPAFNHRVRWEYKPTEEASKLIRDFFKARRKA
ncbi:MAG: nucleoside deaminase [Aquificaceae bacterium]|nr:nucleoside deaminase [Aquificaceae bacterium]